ncbi:MAG: ABC transporter ATP-binding protein [Urechidicola sp.]|nr:ABC transporter ATP-binding protein [Urechidicola sp.]
MKDSNKHSILKTENLSIGYTNKKKKTVIASNLNIELQKGTFVCILGKNGIGKSTLLRTLSKVQPKLSGNVNIHGKDLNSFSEIELAKTMSLVLTEKLPESNLTVFELIALGRQPYTNWVGTLTKSDVDKIHKVMGLTKIEQLSKKKYYELSDGQLQRVLISRALAQETELIILDEPTAHLDVLHKMESFKLLKELASQLNKTVIVSSHEIHLALQTADELWLMTDKEFITGTPKDLIENKSVEKLFDSDTVHFDFKQQQFILKQK